MPSPTLDAPWAGTTFSPNVPNDPATFEAAIVAQLKAQINTFEIAHFPDRPENYRLTHRIGAALVIMMGGEFGELLSTLPIIQEDVIEFEVGIVSRALGWAYASGDGAGIGAYQMMEAVRGALTGFQVPGFSKIYPKRWRFVKRDEEGGVWYYALTLACKTYALEESTADNFPLLTRATADERGGESLEALPAADYTFDGSDEIQLPDANVALVVVKSQDGAQTYVEGTDYSVSQYDGVITRLGGLGVIPSGATVQVSYSKADVAIASGAGGTQPTAPSN
jgi:hypothetical protein